MDSHVEILEKEIIPKEKEYSMDKCKFCFEEFDYQHLLELHVYICHSDENFENIEKSSLKIISSEHQPVEKENTMLDPNALTKTEDCTSEEYLCDSCDIIFNDCEKFVTHFAQHYDQKQDEITYDCAKCYKSFSQKSLFLKHLKSAINENDSFKILYEKINILPPKIDSLSKLEKYKCGICKKQLQSQTDLRKHVCQRAIKLHRKKSEYQTIDPKIKEMVNKHIHQIHNSQKKYKCDSCDKSFSSKEHLKVHTRSVHEGHKYYRCVVCKRSFASKHCLLKHMNNVHEGC